MVGGDLAPGDGKILDHGGGTENSLAGGKTKGIGDESVCN